MRHIGSVSRESLPKLAVEPITSKLGCKQFSSESERAVCKEDIKQFGSYQP
jgi:hypothetical protein